MTKYIDKAAIVAEIERIRRIEVTNNDVVYNGALDEIRYFIDTLEVKEVDLEKEYKEFINCDNGRSMFETAKYFFELGLKAKGK